MIVLLALFVSVVARLEIEIATECASCILVDNNCYNATYLFDLQAPFRKHIVIHKLGVLRNNSILFYSFEPDILDKEYYKVGFVSLDDPNINGVINANPQFIMNFGTFAIDQESRRIYLGGSDGIFVLNAETNNMAPYSSMGDEINSIFYKNYVYFVRDNDRGVIAKRGDYFKTFLEYVPVKKFVVNKYDVIVFINSYGLYVGKGEVTHRLSINPFYRGLAVDIYSEVYAWHIDGIYRVLVDKDLFNSKLVKVAHMPSIGAMAFDKHNRIIFTTDKSVFRLSETKYNCT